MLLLDEPLGALDLKLRKQLQVELKRIQQDVGITFVYVTHDQEEALTMSDRIAVMNRGVIEQLDEPEEIYERPSTTFVAGFIGVSNLMPGEVVCDRHGTVELRLDAGPTVRAGAAGATRRRARARGRAAGEAAAARVQRGGAGGGPSVEGQVESSLYLGTATQVIVRLPDDTRMTVLVPNTDEEARQRLPAAGDGRGSPGPQRTSTWLEPRPEADVTEGPSVSRLSSGSSTDHQRGDQPPPAAAAAARRARSACPRWPTSPPAGRTSRRRQRRRGRPRGDREGRDRLGPLYFANWPLYIDEDRETLKNVPEASTAPRSSTSRRSTTTTSSSARSASSTPQGDSGGRDIHVVTDWMAARMIRLGYVQKFDKSAMPNANANLIDRLKQPPFDPKRDFSMPWQSGMTGIIYRKDKVKREPKSVDDLFDPDYKGKVTMLTEMRDTVGLVAAWHGRRPREGHPRRVHEGDRQGPGGRRLGSDPRLHRQRVHQGHPEGRLVGDLRLVR